MPTVLVSKIALNMVLPYQLLFGKPFNDPIKAAAALPLPAPITRR
jgi:hypothetical protein